MLMVDCKIQQFNVIQHIWKLIAFGVDLTKQGSFSLLVLSDSMGKV